MEGAGDESFSGYTAILEATDGDIGLATEVVGQFFYRLFLLPMVGRDVDNLMVGGIAVGHLADVSHTS